jgi:hypothetical protein
MYSDNLELSDIGIDIIERKREFERRRKNGEDVVQRIENLRVLYETVENEAKYSHNQ